MRMVEPLRQRLPTVWELRSDRAIALGLRIGSSRDAGFEPGRASDCRCRPEPLPADAGRHPDVDAGIDRWMPSSEGGGRALQSNSSWAAVGSLICARTGGNTMR